MNRGAVRRLLMGRSGHDLVVSILLLGALLTPWSVAVPTLQWPRLFAWQSPPALVAIGALALVPIRHARRYAVPLIVVAGLALVGWGGWAAAQLLTPSFLSSGFPFLPIDLIGEGWYIGWLAFAVAVDALAVEASADERPARPWEVWPFALVPGMGLVRLRYFGRGRFWLLAVAFFVFLIKASAVNPSEFQYYGAYGGLPEPRPRAAVLIPFVLGVLTWLASLWDTHQKLRLEKIPDRSILRATKDGDSGAG